MGFLDFFKGEKRSLENPAASLSDFQDFVAGETAMQCTKQAMTLPAVASSLQFIAGAVSGMPVRLYRTRADGGKEEVEDYRTELLNRETGDTLDAVQFKRAIVMDYLLDGEGYAVVNWQRNRIRSINYVSRESCIRYQQSGPSLQASCFWNSS